MKILTDVAAAQAHAPNKRRVLVPTMGALHRGHVELIRAARAAATHDGEVAVSIFVNPLQFEPGSDFEKYPRPIERDEEICRESGVDLLFRPELGEMYRTDNSVYADETQLSTQLEGASRPGHFRGVCTVVSKLFHILSPHAAVFGEKDFQQLAIIRRMVRDLNFPLEVIGVPTVREPDGLACSSRNAYLSEEERKQAPVLHRALVAAKEAGAKPARQILQIARAVITSASLARIDYVELVNVDTLRPAEVSGPNSQLVMAVFFGRTRLIDNMRMG